MSLKDPILKTYCQYSVVNWPFYDNVGAFVLIDE